jgi:GTP:adenosylcobinamide-phosphate guanylyltransferase
MRVEGCLIFWKLKNKVGYYMCRSPLPAGLLPVVIAFLLMTTPALYVTCDFVNTNVNVLACAADNCAFVATIPASTGVFVSCVTSGDEVDGDSQWDYVGLSTSGTLVGYVNDIYVDCNGAADVLCVAPQC